LVAIFDWLQSSIATLHNNVVLATLHNFVVQRGNPQPASLAGSKKQRCSKGQPCTTLLFKRGSDFQSQPPACQPASLAGWQGVGSFAGEAGWVAIFDWLQSSCYALAAIFQHNEVVQGCPFEQRSCAGLPF